MLVTMILNAVLSVVMVLLSWIPDVTTIPFVDEYLSTGMGYFVFLMTIFPPLVTIYSAFLFVMWFRINMILLRFFRVIR